MLALAHEETCYGGVREVTPEGIRPEIHDLGRG